IMEPKDECKKDNNLDILIVPTIGITPKGVRLGYGHGFYDKFLAKNKIETISPVLEKQIISKIPKLEHDIVMDWIVTEKQVIKTQ
ncbi:MAG: 5-formyltetrahydrofolate cyclo-ligase, partial [Nitrosopumilaceae archaeon]|nr:5-formyltetrahydrofolate cyclo-ligase [Nitrosopumilaceae archaeon]